MIRPFKRLDRGGSVFLVGIVLATVFLGSAAVAVAPDANDVKPADSIKLVLPGPAAAEKAGDAARELVRGSGERDDLLSIEVDSTTNAVTVYLDGGASTGLRSKLATDVDRFGGDVKVVRTNMSTASLGQALDAAEPLLDKAGRTMVAPSKDNRELIVTLPAKPSAQLSTQIEESFARDLPGVPVRFDVEPGTVVESAAGGGRDADTSPFRGAAAMRSASGIGCSTGFRAKKASTGDYVMLTARHCTLSSGSPDWFAGREGNGWYIGADPTAGRAGSDASYLNPDVGRSFTNKIYTGSYTSTTTMDVVVGYEPGLGSTVYLSGGFRGQAKALVYDDNYSITDDHGQTIYPSFIVKTANGNRTNGQGDSGSPFYSIHSNGEDAIGRGLFSMMVKGAAFPYSSMGTCWQGPPEYIDRICGDYFVMPALDELETYMGLQVQ